MAAKSGSGASSQELYGQTMTAMIRNYTNAPNEKARQQALKDGIKSLRAFGINDALTEAFEKMAGHPAELQSQMMNITQVLQQGLISRQQDLQKESAQQWMHAMAKPGEAIANVCSMATTVSVIARFFGYNEFSDVVDDKVKEYMAMAKTHFAAPTDRMTIDGSGDMNNAMLKILKFMEQGAAAKSAAIIGNAAAGVTGPENFPHLNGAAGSDASARTKLTWSAFRENMVTAGVAEPTVTKLERLFRENAAFNKGGDNEVLAANEGARLLRQAEAQKILTPADAAKMKGYIERTAEKGPV